MEETRNRTKLRHKQDEIDRCSAEIDHKEAKKVENDIRVGTGRYNDTNSCFAYLKSQYIRQLQPFSKAAQTFLTSKYLMYALYTSLLWQEPPQTSPPELVRELFRVVGSFQFATQDDMKIEFEKTESLPTLKDDFKIENVSLQKFEKVSKSIAQLTFMDSTLQEWSRLNNIIETRMK